MIIPWRESAQEACFQLVLVKQMKKLSIALTILFTATWRWIPPTRAVQQGQVHDSADISIITLCLFLCFNLQKQTTLKKSAQGIHMRVKNSKLSALATSNGHLNIHGVYT